MFTIMYKNVILSRSVLYGKWIINKIAPFFDDFIFFRTIFYKKHHLSRIHYFCVFAIDRVPYTSEKQRYVRLCSLVLAAKEPPYKRNVAVRLQVWTLKTLSQKPVFRQPNRLTDFELDNWNRSIGSKKNVFLPPHASSRIEKWIQNTSFHYEMMFFHILDHFDIF